MFHSIFQIKIGLNRYSLCESFSSKSSLIYGQHC